MATVKLFVGLRIPDNTSLSALHTLEKMGYPIKKLEREIYYEFTINSGQDAFMKKIVLADILVNHNKNTAYVTGGQDERAQDAAVLVENIDDDSSALLHTLRERLGFHMIQDVKKGVYWKFYLAGDVNKVTSASYAKKAAEELLINSHYQQYRLI